MAMELPIADARARSRGLPTLGARRLGARVGSAGGDAWSDPPGMGFALGKEVNPLGRFGSPGMWRAARRDARSTRAERAGHGVAFAALGDSRAFSEEKAV